MVAQASIMCHRGGSVMIERETKEVLQADKVFVNRLSEAWRHLRSDRKALALLECRPDERLHTNDIPKSILYHLVSV